jgi:hypothetical protein
MSSGILFQLEVDAIFISTFVIRLAFVPGDVIAKHHGAIPATPGPRTTAILLGSSSPVVVVASPGAVFGHVRQTLKLPETL